MKVLSKVLASVLAMSMAIRAHSQCFSCNMPEAVDSALLEDISETLRASDHQRQAIQSLHHAYLDAWKALQDTAVATLAAREFDSAAWGSDAASRAKQVHRLIGMAKRALATLSEADEQLFEDIASVLSDEQIALLPVWMDYRRVIATTQSTFPHQAEFDILKLLPNPDEDAAVRLACIGALRSTMKQYAEEIQAAQEGYMRAMADAYDDMADGKIDAKTLMDSTIQINRDVYTQRDAIQDDVARRARTAIKPLAPTAARDLPLRQKLLDGNPTGDAYIRDMIAWLHAIDAAQLEPADAATCIEIVMRLEPLIDSYVQIGHGRGQDPGRVSAALQLVGDASGGLHKAIFTTLGKGIYDRVLAQRDRYQTRTERPLTAAASKSAPDALTSKRLPDALDVHPMSATRFQDLLEILGQYPDDADSWSRFGAAGDEIRGDEVIQSALPRHPPRDGDDRQADFDRWMDAKQQSLERVDAVDAELIRSVADDAPEERIALASAQARCWRRLPIDAAAAEQALRSRFDHLDLVASAAAAGLDLDDPHLASLLLTRTNEFAEIMESHAMACLRARGTPGAAVVAGSTGWATPNDILRPLRDATEEADKAARQAATDAVHEVAAFLPHDQVPAWRRAVAHAAWPCLSRPVDEARSIHVVAVATAPPDVEAALKAAFANLLTDALALQDEITPILINQPLSATTERMKGDDRIRIHARFERTTQRVQQWRDEFNEILSGRPAVAAHP